MNVSRRTIFRYSVFSFILSGCVLSANSAQASTPAQMMQECRVRAHEVLHTRLPNIETKYEGQRTDGTHAVNGTAWIRGRSETFQCSFNRNGRRMIQFVVNQHDGGAAAEQLPEREPQTRTEQVRFRGDREAVLDGELRSGDAVRYTFRARDGQFLHVRLNTRNNRTYFNIFTPNGRTLFESARAGNDYRGQLWLNGEHVVEVYNRSPRASQYNLLIELERAGGAAAGDAQVPGTNFNATGRIPCSHSADAPMRNCDFGVIRHGNGDATVVITMSDGRRRRIEFKGNRASTDANTNIVWERSGGANALNKMSLGNGERYEIPDAVRFGG